MWYPTVIETQKTIPPSDPTTAQRVDSLLEQIRLVRNNMIRG
jgi:hypothetical protein